MKKLFYLVLVIPFLFSCAKEKDSYAFEKNNEKVRKVEYAKTDIEDDEKNSSMIQSNDKGFWHCVTEDCVMGIICSSSAFDQCTTPLTCTCMTTSTNFDDVMADLAAILGYDVADIEEVMSSFTPADLNGDAVIYITNLLASY